MKEGRKKILNQVLSPEAAAEGEWIAGVPRAALFGGKFWTGFESADEQAMFDLVSKNLEFKPRTEEVEHDEMFKQIIPYFLIEKDGKYFTSVRKSTGGDARAHGKRLIGFGGHLRAEDIKDRPIHEWLQREFEEEIVADEIKDISFIGIVNDDSDPTGISQVHFGLVFVIKVEGDVSIRESDKFEDGDFKSVTELTELIPEMESWSKLVTSGL